MCPPLYTNTRFYKFAFIDACYSANNQSLYNAFNMSDGDGQSHAYLGWIGPGQDTYSYYSFSSKVLNDLYYGNDLNTSVWNARVFSGVTNYQIYGDWFMKM